jgi:Flp pilus assembly protein TadB
MNRRAIAPSVLCGGCVALIVGGWVGAVLAILAAALAYQWLRRQPTRVERERRRRIEADLPFAADLLAAALRAGAPPDLAVGCAGRAVGGPLGADLERCERALRLGAPAEDAWSHLGEVDAGRRMAQAAVRSQDSGAALARSLGRVADDLRADRLISADADGRRTGVLIVLPLGLCFLPAFVLAGLVPVIAAVLGGVLH